MNKIVVWLLNTGIITAVAPLLVPLDGKLDAIISRLDQQEKFLMSFSDDMKAQFARTDKATTIIGANVKALLAKLGASGLTDAEKAELIALAKAEADKLEPIAKDSTDAVPVMPEPVPGPVAA